MANTPLLNGVVKITHEDINGNDTLVTFNSVTALNFDYAKGMLQVVDATGSFYFSLTDPTSVTYTIVVNPNGSHTVVIS